MWRKKSALFAALTLFPFGSFAFAEAPAGYQWTTTWADEFNNTGVPDPSKWNYQLGPNGDEAQVYTNSTDNSYVENGHLRITALKGTYTSRGRTYNYSSARLTAYSKYSFLYGRIEARIKMPSAEGTWPAFWTMGNTGVWPTCGEVDIVEYGAGKSPTTIMSNLIYKWMDGSTLSTWNMTFKNGVTPTDGYHNYALEWDANSMKWYYDNALFASVNITPANLNAYAGTNPFSQPHYPILNLAMGGSGGGGIADDFTRDEMLVDYVRVSKLTPIPEPGTVSLLAVVIPCLLRRKRN